MIIKINSLKNAILKEAFKIPSSSVFEKREQLEERCSWIASNWGWKKPDD